MKAKSFALLSIMLIASLPLFAKDKEYKEGTLLAVDRARPSLSTAAQATANGVIMGKRWYFEVQSGAFKFQGLVEKGKVNQDEWKINGPIKAHFEKKGGAVATRTTMFVVKPDGKDEIELNVYSIEDVEGHQYCGTRKCDPDNAEKKAAETQGN